MFIFILFVLFPVAFFAILLKNKHKLEEKSFERRFGALYAGLRMNENKKIPMLHAFYFFLRRVVFVSIIIFLNSSGEMQVIIFGYMSVVVSNIIINFIRPYSIILLRNL